MDCRLGLAGGRLTMARKLRTVTPRDLTQIEIALATLMVSRLLLRKAGAHNSAAYVGRALKSAQGAQRHALRARA